MGRIMSKNLFQKERHNIFRHLVYQYHKEGYSQKESKKLAKKETDEIMEDKESFMNILLNETFDDI